MMTVEYRRSIVSRLIEREAAAGRAIDQDEDFMGLAELWIAGEVDVPEMRRRYKVARADHFGKKRLSLATSQPQSPDDRPTDDDHLAFEIDRLGGHDVSD